MANVVIIWINNAGQSCPYEYCHETDQAYIDSAIDVNLKGVIFDSQVAEKNMIEQGSGQIWNMEGLGSNDMMQEKTIIYGTKKKSPDLFYKSSCQGA